MRRFAFPLLLLLMLILAGCKVGQSADSNSAAASVKTPYSSDTPTEDCYLCGGGIENLIPSYYWGQNNIALISLNTLSTGNWLHHVYRTIILSITDGCQAP